MALSAVGLQTHIWNNQMKSVVLLLCFPLLVVLMVGAFFSGLHMSGAPPFMQAADATHAGMMGMERYGAYAVLGTGIWFIGAWFFYQHMLNWAVKAHPVSRREQPKLYNMLENLCISQGMAMPRFQIIESPALNAFASGLDEKHYTITLTRGLIEALEDDELEAVIGHELTHIINRDARLLVICVIFVGLLSFLSEMAYRSVRYSRPVRYSSHSNRKDGRVLLVALVVLAVGYGLSMLVRFAISRKREYLADAGAVELTKNPEAMMRALMRIQGRSELKRAPEEVKQMFIENASPFLGLFATHPPIERRIATLSEMTGVAVPEVMAGPWE